MENIATINIYPPRIQDKHGGWRSLEKDWKICRVHVGYKYNGEDINIIFLFVG